MKLLIKLFLSFFKLGAFSFGGGYAMISLLEREIAKNYAMISSQEILDILAISEMTPGPIAINSATFVGYRVAGFWGSLVATISVILPSIIIMGLLIFILNKFEESKYVDWFFEGVRPIIIGLIASGAVAMGKNAFPDIKSIIIAVAMFYLVSYKELNGIVGIILAGIVGAILY